MPTYAILGASGYTGRSILTLLLKDPNNTVNCYVRSKSKLLRLFPSLEANKSVRIFDGPLNDIPLIASCVSSDVNTVFCVLGRNESVPGMRIAQDAAQSLVAALLYPEPANRERKMPRIVFLSSCSLNPLIKANEPKLLVWLAATAFSHAYADLALAEAYLRLHKSWLDVTFMTPGALVEDEQKGHVLTMDYVKHFLSYPDLAAGMIEVAETGGYEWKQVGISPTGKNVKFEWKAPEQMAKGMVYHFAPSLGRMAQYIGIF